MKEVSRQQRYQQRLKAAKPGVYYARKKKAEAKYRKSKKYKQYRREYMRQYRADTKAAAPAA